MEEEKNKLEQLPKSPECKCLSEIESTNIESDSYRAGLNIISLSLPQLILYLISWGGDFVTQYYLGQDTNYAASISLAETTASILIAPVTSLVTGLETLIPQSFGKQEYRLCGLYLNRALAYLSLLIIPFYLLLTSSSNLLQLIGVNKEIATNACNLSIYSFPGSYIGIYASAFTYFLSGLQLMKPILYANIIVYAMTPVWFYLFVYVFNIGYKGIVFTNMMSSILSVVFLFLFVKFLPDSKRSQAPWGKEVLQGWQTFFHVCGVSGLMNCLSTWAYLIMKMLATVLTKEETTAHLNLLNLLCFLFMFPSVIGNSLVSIMSDKLGANKVKEAKLYGKVAFVLTVSSTLIIECLVFLFRDSISKAYTSNVVVQSFIKDAIPVVILANFFDTLQAILIKILAALGKQDKASKVLMVSHVVIRLSVAWMFIYAIKIGLNGLWWTYAISYGVAAFGFAIVIIREDWNLAAKQISERIKKDKLN